MTIRKLFFLFWTTFAVGIVTAPIAALLLQTFFGPIGLNIKQELWAGVLYGAIAQMGFFAYLVFNMVAIGFIRNSRLYQGLQLILVIGILVKVGTGDFGEPGSSGLILPFTVLGISLVVAYFKMKATNPNGFIPALFFMVAATMLEAIPSLEQQSLAMIMLMVLTLLACNTWQVMQLHRLVESKATEATR